MELTIEFLPLDFSVCQVKDFSQVNLNQDFVFTGKTEEECSLVCPTELVPQTVVNREDGWIGLRVCGVLDFSLIGILADIAGRLAEAHVSIFAISTFNTDYILIKKESKEKAVKALEGRFQIRIL